MSKYYEVLDTICVEENIILNPGDVVEVEFIDAPNFYPCLVINCELFDISLDNEEFNKFFREVEI